MRGHITKRGRRSWRLKFDVEPIGGRRQIRYVTVQGTRKDAEARLASLLTEVNTGVFVDPDKATVATYLRQWLGGMHGLSAGSIETYATYIETRLIPAIGNIPLQKLRPAHVKNMLDGMVAHRGAARYSYGLLRSALQAAVETELLSRNVCSSIRRPAAETAEVDILLPAEITTVFEALRGSALFSIVSLALATGMRRGELLALRWQDIDGPMVTVCRSIEETKAGFRFKAPKTKAGRRIISIPPSTVRDLADHRRQQLELRMKLGLGKPGPHALVFCDHEDRPLRGDRVTLMWKRAMDSIAGMPKVKFHALRHTHASALIAAGIDVVTVSRRLGHCSPAMTLGVYSHLFSKTDTAAAAAIAKLLG
jgi:integrase